MARTPADERFLEERDALAPLGEPAALLPTPEVDMTPPAGLPGAPTAVPTSGASPNPYGPGADAAAFEAALRDRQNADTTATFEDAATLFNKAGGGTAGDLAASTRAHRDDSFNDVMHRRAIADQDAATKKKQHEEALAAALELPDSPETKKILDFYGATTVGKAMLGNMTPEQRARLTGNMIPGAKELLASDTELMKEHLKAQAKLPGPGGVPDPSVAALAKMLESDYPEKFAVIKDDFLKSDPKRAGTMASLFLRQNLPSTSLFTDIDGWIRERDRKKHLTTLPPPLNGPQPPTINSGGEHPIPTDIGVKEPGSIPATPAPASAPTPETPKARFLRENAMRSLGAPNKGWEFDPEVTAGQVAPPAKKEVDAARKLTTAASTGLDYGERIAGFLAKHPDGYPSGPDATAAQGWQVGLQTMVRTANEMGVYRPAEQPMINKATSDPTSLTTILKSAVGIHDLKTELSTLMEEMRQRAWVANQQAHIHPTADNTRWAGFKPVVAGAQPTPQGPPGGSLSGPTKRLRNKVTGLIQDFTPEQAQKLLNGG